MDPEKLLTIITWPLAFVLIALLLAVIFRTPVAALIGRIIRLKFGGHAIDLSRDGPTVAVEQQRDVPSAPRQPETVPASHAMPPPSPVYASIEEEVRRAVAAAAGPADLKEAWLIRAIAVHRVNHGHEMVYRIILGSQISLLLLANTNAPPDMQKARELYDAAKAAFPQLYEGFPFEMWVRYPINVGLAWLDSAATAARIKITPIGQDFLHYLVNNGLTSAKFG
jgi:hypothetical protein